MKSLIRFSVLGLFAVCAGCASILPGTDRGPASAAADPETEEELAQRLQELEPIVPTERTAKGFKVTLKDEMLFEKGRTELKPSAGATLQQLSQVLAKYPNDILRIEGYTGPQGPGERNQKLTEDRALAIQDYLEHQGLKNDLKARGRGEDSRRGVRSREDLSRVEIHVDIDRSTF